MSADPFFGQSAERRRTQSAPVATVTQEASSRDSSQTPRASEYDAAGPAARLPPPSSCDIGAACSRPFHVLARWLHHCTLSAAVVVRQHQSEWSSWTPEMQRDDHAMAPNLAGIPGTQSITVALRPDTSDCLRGVTAVPRCQPSLHKESNYNELFFHL